MELAEINRNLKKYLPKGSNIIKKAMRYSVLSGGKRIRSILAIEASRVCAVPSLSRGRGNLKDMMPIACAIEFVHTYSLIHDDLPAMDNDDLRRGRSACHKVFGDANAILAGDALLTLAFNIIAGHTRPKAGLKIIKELSDAVGVDGMVGGQALDLEFQDREKNKTLIYKINLLKTARLFAASAKIGAIAAGADMRETAALEKFGLYFGLSFQIVDDYIDGEGRDIKESGLFIDEAKDELRIFGKRADVLKGMADSLLRRKR